LSGRRPQCGKSSARNISARPASARVHRGVRSFTRIRHVYIRPRTPHLNGKVERSHRIDDQEFYQLLDKDGVTDDIHLFNEKLQEWEDYYNYHRPHWALDGQTPYERLVAKTKARSLPTS
jgi:transposase InsO family protein